MAGISSLGADSRIGMRGSLEAHFGVEGNISLGGGWTWSDAYFTDANADGLPDLVNGETVLFNKLVCASGGGVHAVVLRQPRGQPQPDRGELGGSGRGEGGPGGDLRQGRASSRRWSTRSGGGSRRTPVGSGSTTRCSMRACPQVLREPSTCTGTTGIIITIQLAKHRAVPMRAGRAGPRVQHVLRGRAQGRQPLLPVPARPGQAREQGLLGQRDQLPVDRRGGCVGHDGSRRQRADRVHQLWGLLHHGPARHPDHVSHHGDRPVLRGAVQGAEL